jgi:hypothetical protein
MKKETLEQQARRLGISISTLKRQQKEARDAKKVKKAEHALRPQSKGWNPRAGNKEKK